MSYENLTITRHAHIAVVAFNRPAKYNALNVDLMLEIEKVTKEFQGDVETRVVIFTGAGKHFSAGADLESRKEIEQDQASLLIRKRLVRLGPRMIRCLREMDQITIAAINGGALGGAACIATALDFRIGAQDSFISYPEILLGMNLSWEALPLCVHLVGPSKAKRLVILGEREPAGTLLEWGFLDEVVSAERLLPRAMEIAAVYAARPPLQAQMIKRSVNVITSALDAAIMHMDSDQFLLASTTRDHAEGVKAFFEKRKPEFKGD